MNTLKCRNIVFGEGKPKLCIPVFGRTDEEIFAQARTACGMWEEEREDDDECVGRLADVIEWRADWYDCACEPERVKSVLTELRSILGDTVLLFTFRTRKEGGEGDIAGKEYEALNKAVIDTGMADFIDVEVFMDRDITASLVEYAHSRGVAVIGSNHHFHETPAKEEMVDILRRMQELDADIPKLAVMPANKRDMMALLEATLEMSEDFADRPIITMSMGRDGMMSRVAGEIFGSAMTFGAVKKASAPGQIEAKALSNLLYEIHKNINV